MLLSVAAVVLCLTSADVLQGNTHRESVDRRRLIAGRLTGGSFASLSAWSNNLRCRVGGRLVTGAEWAGGGPMSGWLATLDNKARLRAMVADLLAAESLTRVAG